MFSVHYYIMHVKKTIFMLLSYKRTTRSANNDNLKDMLIKILPINGGILGEDMERKVMSQGVHLSLKTKNYVHTLQTLKTPYIQLFFGKVKQYTYNSMIKIQVTICICRKFTFVYSH